MTSFPPITERDVVRAIMTDASFVPHGPSFPVAGSTLRLREQMARFSAADDHPPRRADVVRVIDRLDVARVEEAAARLTEVALADGMDVDRIASTVPTVTLARLLDLDADDGQLASDVESVVQVIGRGAAPSTASDAATDRLLGLDGGSGVAVVSVLYQNFDATGAAIRAADAARETGGEPAPAVERTKRVATGPTAVAGRRFGAGEEVVLEIAAAGYPFGTGPHECPGRQVAEAIVRGVTAALERGAT